MLYLDQEMCHCFPALCGKYFRSPKTLCGFILNRHLEVFKCFDQYMGIRREILVGLEGSGTKLESDMYDLLQEIQWLGRSFLSALK